MKLDLDPSRAAAPPIDAATVMVLRTSSELEVFCIERAKASRFLGGAIVFPGGKVDPLDADPRWRETSADPLVVCALRECFEESCMLHISGVAPELLIAWHAEPAVPLLERLVTAGAKADGSAFAPIARWVTPVAEARRFDTRFFLARAPEGQEARVDGGEATRGLWATPARVLDQFARGEIALFPPTHRMLEVLARFRRWEDVAAYAKSACLDPICPEVVQMKDTVALVLPGDPAHSIREPRIEGRSRYVLRGEQWLPEGTELTGRSEHTP